MISRRMKALVSVVAAGATAGVIATAAVAAKTSHATTKAGLVSDVGKFNDRSFNQSALLGLKKAEKTLGVSGRPIQSTSASDYIPNLSQLARQNYDVTIGVGFLMADSIATVAKKFPKNNFAIVDFSQAGLKGKPKNVRGITFATNENSYMIGYLAGLMAKKQGGPQVISAVGGLKIPTVTIFIAGYTAGAKKANPGIKVLTGYSQEFVKQDPCKELALNQINQGSQVVFAVAGGCGLGALDAAKENGKWGVGVDIDQSFLGSHILTSAVKRVDVSVFDTIKDAKAGTLTGGDKLYNLANNGVAVGKISSKVPKAFIAQMNALKPKIIAGKIKIPTS